MTLTEAITYGRAHDLDDQSDEAAEAMTRGAAELFDGKMLVEYRDKGEVVHRRIFDPCSYYDDAIRVAQKVWPASVGGINLKGFHSADIYMTPRQITWAAFKEWVRRLG